MGLIDFLSDLVTSAIAGLGDIVGDITIALMMVLFGVSPLRTEGPFPFGQPVAPEIVGPHAGLNGGLLGYMAKVVYPKVSLVDGGEIIIFSILMYVILQSVAGWVLFFDPFSRDPDPTEQRDPVAGFFLMLFWFPIYYGFLSLTHYLYLFILPDPNVIAGLVTTILASAGIQIAVGFGTIFLILFPVLLVLIGALMMVRAILAASYLLFGPFFIAVGWANIPTASDQALTVLKYGFGLAAAPLPLPILLWIWSFFLSPSIGIPGLGFISAFAQLSQGTLGLIVMDVLLIFSLWLSWKVFKKTGGYIDKVGGSAMRVGASAGIYKKTGDARAAQQALRHGPGKAASKQAFKGADTNYWKRAKEMDTEKIWDRVDPRRD